MDSSIYDEDYFEYGLMTGRSCYSYYRWMPEATCSQAMAIIDYLGIKENETILDWGCAKGFLVKAFRLLRRQAWGMDISSYAISKADESVSSYLKLVDIYTDSLFERSYNYCIAKDVFEHIFLTAS